jgi:bifunctional non-homologous end joining protein LigD
VSPIVPMKATTARLPVGAGWVYELKWDGMRAIVEVGVGPADPAAPSPPDDGTGAAVRIWSGNGIEATVTYPELAVLAEAFAGLSVVLDGEIVALDDAGIPSFGRLQQRMHIHVPVEAAERAAEVPVALVLFDLLAINGRSTLDLPWRDRRKLLETVADDLPPGVRLASTFTDGTALLEAARRQGMEGVMAKRVDSPYRPGRRSPDWIKVKVDRRQELVIGGWATGKGERTGTLGALLVGYYEPDPDEPARRRLHYAGRVGTGFTGAVLDELRRRLRPLATPDCPFAPPPPRNRSLDASWVRPELVAEIGFGHWTADDILRHPVYHGLRPDKDPRAVVREPSPGT